MTHISTPTIIPRVGLPRPAHLRLAVGASIEAMCGLLGKAFTMAYVDPFTSSHRYHQIVPDENLEGRDPRW